MEWLVIDRAASTRARAGQSLDEQHWITALNANTLKDGAETIATRIPACRSSLIAGDLRVPIEIGLTARATHFERSERDCFSAALPTIAQHLGPAVRVIDSGLFAGLHMATLLGPLERPKAGIILSTHVDQRLFERLQQGDTTAQITCVSHDITTANWPLDAMAAGRTLVVISGGGFGLMPHAEAFSALENASQSLSDGDFVLVSLENVRDSAVLDVTYRDFGGALVSQALSQLGRSVGFEARIFYDPPSKSVRFGAVAQHGATISWNDTLCWFDQGAWLDMGAMRLHDMNGVVELHPDFQVHEHWTSQDKVVTLVLLRKI